MTLNGSPYSLAIFGGSSMAFCQSESGEVLSGEEEPRRGRGSGPWRVGEKAGGTAETWWATQAFCSPPSVSCGFGRGAKTRYLYCASQSWGTAAGPASHRGLAYNAGAIIAWQVNC